LAGKLIVAPAVFLATPSAAGAPLIHLKDTKTHISYLVDTGAAISLLPFSSSQHPSGSGPKLVNASGASIPSWNFVFKNLKFGNHTFVHSFLQSAVSQPILGMDFLSLHDPSSELLNYIKTRCKENHELQRSFAGVFPGIILVWV